MEGILKVTPEKLIQAAGDFSAIGTQMKNLMGEMLSLVRGLSAGWLGEAAVAYGNKFDSLQPDMEKLYRMVQEHVQDLQEMAGQYQAAESGNTDKGSSMQSQVVS